MATLLACGASQAPAQESGGLVFATGQPLSLSWRTLVEGVSVEICNASRATVPRFRVIPTDFGFKREAVPVPSSKVLAVKLPSEPVRAGACAPIELTAVSETRLDPGEYPGTLLLIAAGHGGSARLQTTVRTTPGKAANPSGVVEPVTLSLGAIAPWSDGGDAKLVLKDAAPGEQQLTIGERCNKAAPNSNDCPFLGIVYQEGTTLRVSVNGAVKHGRDVQELPILLEGAKHPVGAYEGSLTLPGASQAIKVKVNAKDSVIAAIAALLVGAVLALGSQWWNGHARPKRALEKRNSELGSNYGDGVPGYRHIVISPTKLEDYVSQVDAAIKQYASSVVMFDPKSDAYVAIDASLKQAEGDAKLFRDPAKLKQALDRLAGEFQRTIKMLEQKEVTETPGLLRRAAKLLGASALGVGEPTQNLRQAEQLSLLLADWSGLVDRVLTHAVWLKHIVGSVAAADLSAVDAETLAYAGPELWFLRERLFQTADASELAAIQATGAPEFAMSRVAQLGRQFAISKPAPEQAPAEFTGNLADVRYLVDGHKTLTIKQVLTEPTGLPVEPAKAAKLPPRDWRLWIGDRLVLLVTVVVSVVAGLSTFYFNKSFGSVEDYLTVVVVGAAAQTLLKAIVNQMEVLLHGISPDTPALPAKIVASPAPPNGQATPANAER